MEVVKKLGVKLTGKEYQLLQDAASLIDDINAEINTDVFGEGYDLKGVEYIIYAFLDDTNVEVDWE